MGFDLKAVQYEPTEGPLPSDKTFHATVWSWRAMTAALDAALEESDFQNIDGAEACGFVFNDGYTVPRPRAIELAEAAEAWLEDAPDSHYLTLCRDGEGLLRAGRPETNDIEDGSAWTTTVGMLRRLLRFFRTSGGFEIW